jgi:alcohol dehydrogenase (cytochrome c)
MSGSRPGEPGDETWAGAPFEKRWMSGVWGQLTYDPELDLVYYGSSGVGPASKAERNMPGATMAGTNTRFAVRPKTGEVVWKHQVLPRDNWDQNRDANRNDAWR